MAESPSRITLAGRSALVTGASRGLGAEIAAVFAAAGADLVLTQAMAAEWGRFNIQANAVAPTVILTEMGQQVWGDPAKGDPMKARIPARRFGEPVEVADLVLFLASPASNFICGQVLRLDGGLSAAS